MKYRRIKREDIKEGLSVFFEGGREAGKVSYLSDDKVIYCDSEWDSLHTVLEKRFMIDEETGIKNDQDKLKPTLLLNDMPLAIKAVLEVLKFGAEKYSEGNWLNVDNGEDRYRNAGLRHLLAVEEKDRESGSDHLSHAVTSLLMELELKLRRERDAE